MYFDFDIDLSRVFAEIDEILYKLDVNPLVYKPYKNKNKILLTNNNKKVKIHRNKNIFKRNNHKKSYEN